MIDPITIIHKDKTFVVISKKSGFLSVPGRRPEHKDCVTERVKELFPECIEQPSVHRLDMDTSGLMVVALTKESHRNLSIQFQDRWTEKTYIALLDGIVEGDCGMIELAFRLDVDNRPIQIYDPESGKMGITQWKKLEVKDGITRIEFTPVTGRTHQLRVHSSHHLGLGIPIVGDPFYGTETEIGKLKLHANFLSFYHPETEEKLSFYSDPSF
ncbi:RluA family pseudouridine synthase [bacterium]|nr:RluA family pseudouridine synthase [bacterium]